MDEGKRLEIHVWLVKAQQDLRSAEWLITSPDHLYNSVGFHCQQAAEKTHSLVALVGKCLPFESAFESLRLAASTLTPYAVTFRYPGELPELSADEAEQAVLLARQVWDLGLGLLPVETHPQNQH